MKYLYFHPWALSSKESGGISIVPEIKRVLSNCGLECTEVCEEDECGSNRNSRGTSNRSIETKEENLQKGLSMILSKLSQLEQENISIKDQLEKLKSGDTGSV